MADASCPGIVSNPDLVGTGTRLNFYVTILLATIIPQNKYTISLLDELYANAVFFGLAVLITVFVQTIQERLDLYHAIFVTHILFNLSAYQNYGIKMILTDRRYSFKMKIALAIQLFQILFFFPSWALYVWTKGSRFGSQPRCNDLVKYVFFFVSVRGTVSWLRILAIVFFSIRMISSLIIFRDIVSSLWTAKAKDREMYFKFRSRSHFRPGTRRLFSILAAVYGIVTTELIVHRNRPYVQAGDSTWGFAQVASVLLLWPIFIEVLVALKEWRSGGEECLEE
ncbi:hypothetical protein V8E53_010052 [Lactarius tabidus]